MRSVDRRLALFVVSLACVAALAVPAAAHINHVTAAPQGSPDGVVYVGSVSVVDRGPDAWVALHAGGEPVGHAPIDPAEVPLYDVPVELYPGAWANTSGSRTLRVELYLDDGDDRFEPAEDERVSRGGLFEPATLAVRRAEARAYLGAATLGPQRTGGMIEVRKAVLPEPGHLVVRNASAGGGAPGDRGAVVGHRALPAGTHEGVEVHLNRTFLASQSGSFFLRATLYVDDGDGGFDDGDRPIVVGNTTVGSTLRLRKVEGTPTPTPGESQLVTTPTDGANGTVEPGATAERNTTADTGGSGASGSSGAPDTTDASGAPAPGFGIATAVLSLLGLAVVVGYHRHA